jgi:hypothetical protein
VIESDLSQNSFTTTTTTPTTTTSTYTTTSPDNGYFFWKGNLSDFSPDYTLDPTNFEWEIEGEEDYGQTPLGLLPGPELTPSILMARIDGIEDSSIGSENGVVGSLGTGLWSEKAASDVNSPHFLGSAFDQDVEEVYAGFFGSIAEILVYDSPLTSSEINKIETYLSIKWGIPLLNLFERSILPADTSFQMSTGDEINVGIFNEWSIMFRSKRGESSAEELDEAIWIDILDFDDNSSRITVTNDDSTSGDGVRYMEVRAYDTDSESNGLLQAYRFPPDISFGPWELFIITYDGTRAANNRIKLYKPRTEDTTAIEQSLGGSNTGAPVGEAFVDDSITMTNTTRAITFRSNQTKNQHAIWNRVLTDEEIVYIGRNIGMDLNRDSDPGQVVIQETGTLTSPSTGAALNTSEFLPPPTTSDTVNMVGYTLSVTSGTGSGNSFVVGAQEPTGSNSGPMILGETNQLMGIIAADQSGMSSSQIRIDSAIFGSFPMTVDEHVGRVLVFKKVNEDPFYVESGVIISNTDTTVTVSAPWTVTPSGAPDPFEESAPIVSIWDPLGFSLDDTSVYNLSNEVIGSYGAAGNLTHWYRPGFDENNIGKDYSQLAFDAGETADMSTPPGPPGVITNSGFANQEDLVVEDIPEPTIDGVPNNGQGGF